VGVAAADCAHNASVQINGTTGNPGSEVEDTGNVLTTAAYNTTGIKIWDGAKVLIQWCVSGGSGGGWHIVKAWSATRCRGTSPAGGIAAAASGTLTSVSFHDGTGPASVSAYNANVNIGIEGSVQTWAEWTEANNRWEIYAADCTP